MAMSYIVNTNLTNNPMNEIEMLENQKVACYHSPWKYFINEWQSTIWFIFTATVKELLREDMQLESLRLEEIKGKSIICI